MAKFTKNESKSKNQFTARTVSRKTGRMIAWVHPVDDFARAVAGVASIEEMTAQQAQDLLPRYYENDLVELIVTDLTSEREVVAPEDF